MASRKLPRVVKAFNLYIDGDGYAGRADSITLPALTFVKEDHRAGGMDAPKGIELGMEKLVLSMVVSDLDPRILGRLGVDGLPLVARGSVQEQGQEAEAVNITMRGDFSSLEFGNWKPGTKTALTITADLDYFRYRQNDVEYAEIDVVNMVRSIFGVDQLARHRANIGL